MSEEKPNQSIKHTLNKSLESIDEKTQNELSSIRRRVLQSAQEQTATDVNHLAQNNIAVLSVHPIWRSRKVASLGLAAALAASVFLVVLMPGLQQQKTQDFSAEFSLYTEVDPDWLSDMEIAYVLGEE
jgi:type VI protein secretion system component VasF